MTSRYEKIRSLTRSLCEPLTPEDCVIQPALPHSEASPPKWHLAHTTWFFETFLLKPKLKGYDVFDPRFDHLFNSYYETHGSHLDRSRRGVLSRPSLDEVYRYRRYVDQAVASLPADDPEIARVLTLGLEHEMQHQELILMDIKYTFYLNPLRPPYRSPERERTDSGFSRTSGNAGRAAIQDFKKYSGGLVSIGMDETTPGQASEGISFSFDNERPRHLTFLKSYELCSALVTNGEYLEFIESGAYAEPGLWLSDGWATIRREGWNAPLYWEKDGSRWQLMTLAGMQPLAENEPVCHLSYYEADAYARWRGARLPTEAEWEHAARNQARPPERENFLESGIYHPISERAPDTPSHFGNLWQWTQSPYAPYPGYRPFAGNFAEYNGKFMCNQQVLRGGSCVTPAEHIRASYRNFFPAEARWPFTGMRLAR